MQMLRLSLYRAKILVVRLKQDTITTAAAINAKKQTMDYKSKLTYDVSQ